MKPICVACGRFYRMKKAGFYFREGMPKPGLRARPGHKNDHEWQDYKLWSGDLWECQGCGTQIISGCGFQPVREHYQDDFEETAQRVGAVFRVNDC